MLRWLLDRGANPNLGKPVWGNIQPDTPADTKSGQALNRAADLATIAVVNLLLQRGAKLEYSISLHIAAASRRPDVEAFLMMQHLLDLGVNINGLDDLQGPHNHGTPLHYAARGGKVERVRFLLEKGANSEIRNRQGRTPLEEAKKFSEEDVVTILKPRV
jgi:ankyrin repeat protein